MKQFCEIVNHEFNPFLCKISYLHFKEEKTLQNNFSDRKSIVDLIQMKHNQIFKQKQILHSAQTH